jgi:hypothetical protein
MIAKLMTVKDDPQKFTEHGIIDQDKRLIVYVESKGGSTLYFNASVST